MVSMMPKPTKMRLSGLKANLDLEEYIDTINIFDIRKFVSGVSAASGNAPTSEVSAIGRFISGEQIMFSKFYKAIVYNPP